MSCTICIPKRLFRHTVEIQGAQIVKSGMGAGQRKYPPAGGTVKRKSVKCLVVPLSSNRVIEFMREGMRATHDVFFRDDPELDLTDRLVFGGRYLEVRGFIDVGEMGVLWQVLAEEVVS